MNTPPTAGLPPLPEPHKMIYESSGNSQRWVVAGLAVPPGALPVFTADQMHAYALSAVACQSDAMAALAAKDAAIASNQPKE